MKKIILLSLMISGLVFMTTPVKADVLVADIDPPGNTDTNPQWFSPSNPAEEEAWLEGLLGLTYNNPNVVFVSKDEDGNPLDNVPANWTYAVLKYGVGRPSLSNPDHWAIQDNGNSILELGSIGGLPSGDRLSHVTYFLSTTSTTSVPEPNTLILLGIGLISALGLRRKIKG